LSHQTVRKFTTRRGRIPPAARFYITNEGRACLYFNLQAMERFGIGTRYRSANLSHVQNHDTNSESILLELFTDPESGQVKLSFHDGALNTKVGITSFLREFDVTFQQRVSYPIWISGESLYVDLASSLEKSA